jgi:uncharacterized protein (DUF433 family)
LNNSGDNHQKEYAMIAARSRLKDRIEKTPDICGGDPCIRGTRITVHGLVEWRRLGLSDARIMEGIIGLTQDDLNAAWEYYEENSEEIERILKEEAEA